MSERAEMPRSERERDSSSKNRAAEGGGESRW